MSGSQTPNTAEREEPRTDGRVLLQAGSEAGARSQTRIAKRFVKEPRCPEPHRENTRKGFKGRSGLRDFFSNLSSTGQNVRCEKSFFFLSKGALGRKEITRL